MITILTNLKDIIKNYGIPHLNQEEDKQIEQTLLSELAKIENDSHTRYFGHNNREMAQESFRQFYTKLISLFNLLYQKKEQQPDIAILKFHKLIKTFEELYNRDMVLNAPLTDYQYQLLKAEITGRFPALKEVLHKKGVPEFLLFEIQSALDGHFNNNDSKLRYHHYLFYNKLLQVLTKIAKDDRPKEWDRRFIETMININFNHMGFFNRLGEIINYQLKNLCKGHQIICVDINSLRISQASRTSTLIFDTSRRHLADLLIEHADVRKNIKEPNCHAILKNQSDEITGILSNLTVGELIVFYHYFHKAKFLKAVTKKIGANNFASHVLTINNAKISEVQLVKFDKKKYVHEIKSLRKKLAVIFNLIDIDLDDAA